MKSATVLAAIAERHSDDVFVAEAKDGPQGNGVLRLDAWAMRKSWANYCISGYEIKVSRSDWLNDDKWRNYIPCVNEMWIACPKGVVKPEEVPEGVGLAYASSTGSRLVTKRKPVWAKGDLERQQNVMSYVLMWRTRIKDEFAMRCPEMPMELRKEWLQERDNRRTVGRAMSRKIGRAFREAMRELKSETTEATKKNERANYILSEARRLGLDFGPYDTEERKREAVACATKGLNIGQIRNLGYQASRVLQGMQDAKDGFDQFFKTLGIEKFQEDA